MDYSDKIIRDLLHQIINELKDSYIKDLIFIFIGGFIGFLSSYVVYRFSEKKKAIELLDKLLIELSGLAEEIKHNIFNLKSELYVNEYFLKLFELSDYNEEITSKNNNVVQWNRSKIETRLYEKERLAARFQSKITEFKLVHGESADFTNVLNDYQSFNLKKNYFADAKDIEQLKKMYSKNFTSIIEEEIKIEFEPKLHTLLLMIEDKTLKRKKKLKMII